MASEREIRAALREALGAGGADETRRHKRSRRVAVNTEVTVSHEPPAVWLAAIVSVVAAALTNLAAFVAVNHSMGG